MASALVERREALAAKQADLAKLFDAAKQSDDTYDFTKVSGYGLEGDQKARTERVNALNDELETLASDVKGLQATHEQAQRVKALGEALGQGVKGAGIVHPDPEGDDEAQFRQSKSLGEMFVAKGMDDERAYLKGWRPGGSSDGEPIDMDLGIEGMKTLMTTSAGWAPQAIRTGRVVEAALRPIQVLDLIPSTTTDQIAVVYMIESLATNAAAEVAEAGTFPESAFAYSEANSPVRKIATFLPVTDEQLEDVPQLQGIINNRLTFFLRQRLDGQVLVGNGTPPNLQGILNRSGLLTQARGTDPGPDAVYKAMVQIMLQGRATPDGIAMHPIDAQNMRLLRTSDGIYIWGSPSERTQFTLWGLPVAQADSLTQGTALVGAFQAFSELAVKRNVTLQVSNSHGTFFIEGKQAIRADMRAALQVYRPAAFSSVTGL